MLGIGPCVIVGAVQYVPCALSVFYLYWVSGSAHTQKPTRPPPPLSPPPVPYFLVSYHVSYCTIVVVQLQSTKYLLVLLVLRSSLILLRSLSALSILGLSVSKPLLLSLHLPSTSPPKTTFKKHTLYSIAVPYYLVRFHHQKRSRRNISRLPQTSLTNSFT